MRHAATHEITGDGGKIIMRQALARMSPGVVPARAELAAAANVRDHMRAAKLQPEFADADVVIGLLRESEAAIPAHQDGRVAGFRRRTDLDIGYAHAINGGRFMARDGMAVRIEDRRAAFQDRRGRTGREQLECRLHERGFSDDEQVAVGFCFLDVQRPGRHHAGLRQSRKVCPLPSGRRWSEDGVSRAQIVEDEEDQSPTGPKGPLHRDTFASLEENFEADRS